MNAVDRLVDRFLSLPGVRVVHGVHERYDEDRGTYLAAAITYYLIVAVVPAGLLGLAIAGFVLSSVGAEGIAERLTGLAEKLPGLDVLIDANLDELVKVRTWAGVIALLGLVWAGTGGLAAVRNAMSAIFRFPHRELSGFIVRAQGLAILGLLLLAFVLVTIAMSLVTLTGVLGTSLTFVLGAALETLVVLLLYRVFTPKAIASTRDLAVGALTAGLGVAALALLGSWWIGRVVTKLSAIYGTFAAFIGILVLFNLAAVLLLHGAEFAAWRKESRAEGSAQAQ